MAKIKLSKEERKARQQQIRQLWRSAGIKDIAGVESLIQGASLKICIRLNWTCILGRERTRNIQKIGEIEKII